MKTKILLAALVFIFVALVVQWRMDSVAAARAAAASSQIYIHGTPVCVMKHWDAIVAMVGKCEAGSGGEEPGGDSLEGTPFHGFPGGTLPPGHPPVSPDMSPHGASRVAI